MKDRYIQNCLAGSLITASLAAILISAGIVLTGSDLAASAREHESALDPQRETALVNANAWTSSNVSPNANDKKSDADAGFATSETEATPQGTVFIAGRVVDLNGNNIRGLTVRALTSNGTALTSVTSSFGLYRFEDLPAPETYIITPISRRHRFAPQIVTVTADTPNINFISEGSPTINVNAGPDQIISLPNTVPLNGSVSGGIAPLTAAWSRASGPGNVVFANPANATTTATITTEGTYILRLTATDAASFTAFDEVRVVIGPPEPPPPPDPVTIAPPVDQTVATTRFEATKFLYTGPNAIQTGVVPGTIKAERVATFRGRVITRGGEPIPNVKITVLNGSEFGQTMSRADGMFDLVVNGGGVLDVKYEKLGYISVQREGTPDWQEAAKMDDVVMIPYDGNSTFIDLGSSAPIQVAQSGIITDSSGTRRSRLFFKQGTSASMKLPNGSTQALTTINVRATEFTTGVNGPETMPGDLPANSAYTYAVEYSLDEAVAAGATETTFSQPVIQYNENFLNFPIGINIPSGAYDRVTGQWVPSVSGRVVKILSTAGGIASLDVNGNGSPATDTEYSELGINVPERQQLALLYPPNQGLWRVPLIHFSPWDSNWPYGPPPDAEPPSGDPPPECDT